MKITVLFAALVGAFASLAGCSSFDTLDEHETGARMVVEVATLAAIERSSDRAATANRVIAAATDARAWIDFDGVTLEELAAKARTRIAGSDLELSEKAGLNALVTILQEEISANIEAGALDPQTKVTVNRLLDWVVASAQAYAG
jgi:outer membrane murein-binding lipoprotein Lpp